MKLKEIPQNTVVHTPTEAEARKLLAILHEGGYEWYASNKDEKGWQEYQDQTCYRIDSENGVYHKCDKLWYETICQYCILPVLTLAEFKERYLIPSNSGELESQPAEKEPQPKFKVGDKVRVLENAVLVDNIGKIATIIKEGECCKGYGWVLDISKSVFLESELEPYTEPEAKGNNSENSQLDLCELLADHIGAAFYSPYLGQCHVSEITPDEEHNHIWLKNDEDVWVALPSCGHEPDGAVMLFPSRALYEQYPLEPLKAWSVWQEEQNIKCRIWLSVETKGERTMPIKGFDTIFRTPADRDKCIEVIDAFLKEIQQSKSVASLCEEIKAIIEKYSKK